MQEVSTELIHLANKSQRSQSFSRLRLRPLQHRSVEDSVFLKELQESIATLANELGGNSSSLSQAKSHGFKKQLNMERSKLIHQEQRLKRQQHI
jgi:hypothetical protein